MLAGLPNYVWTSVDEIYNVRGSQKYFDAVAAHPYTRYPAGVLTILQRVRDVMNRHHDTHKPIIAGEVGFNDGTLQAHDLASLLPMLGNRLHRLHLLGFYDYTWVDPVDPSDPFRYYGLFHLKGGRFLVKRGYYAFRGAALRLEGCRVKAAVATRCLRR